MHHEPDRGIESADVAEQEVILRVIPVARNQGSWTLFLLVYLLIEHSVWLFLK